MKRLMLVVSCLLCAGGAFAHGWDPEVWITLGGDALPAVQEAFWRAGLGPVAVPTDRVGEVVVLRLRESQLPLVARVMHDRFNRCAGFLSHESRDHALSQLADPTPQLATQEVAVQYTLDNAAVVNAMLAQLQAAEVQSTITTLSAYTTRYYTSQTGVDAANWLKTRWQTLAQGRSDVTVQLFNHAGWAQPSVILTIQGTTFPSEVVVLGGHLDSINSGGGNAPGADDDASGIASITEALRVAMALNYRPQKTVKLMAYAAEEVGLRGSSEIATQHRTTGVNVVGVLQLDMTNYKGSTVDVGLLTDNTNAAQNTFIQQLINTYGGGITWQNTQCGYGCSDHVSWTNNGFPASLPFEALMGQHNQAIHTANDTLATSGGNANHALKFSKIAVAYMAELAKGDFTGGGGPVGSTAVYDATLRVPKCATATAWCESGTLLNGRGTVGPEVNQPNTINGSCADGTSGTYHSDESNDWIKVATTDGSNLAAGKTVRVEARVWAYSTYTSDKLDLYYTANAASPTWTFLATLSPTAAGQQTLSATYTLPSGALQAVRARFRYQGAAAACATGSYIDHDDLAFTVGGGTPDTTPPSVSVTAPAAGSTVSGTVTITASASDNVGVTQVELYVDGVLKGTDASSPYSYAWDTATASNGSHSLTAKAYDGAGNSTTSAAVGVTVSNSSSAAVYDPTLRAPKCATVGSACDSGTLLNGRRLLGPEPNQPNTINGSCADGASGTYHVDESNDRIKVSTVDGTAFAPGKSVRVEATVWAYSSYTSDKLDLYYAANASSPTWTLIGTFTPAGSGARVITATYTLPAGALQAVRARFRYQGTAAACGTGAYDDADDLIFAVQ